VDDSVFLGHRRIIPKQKDFLKSLRSYESTLGPPDTFSCYTNYVRGGPMRHKIDISEKSDSLDDGPFYHGTRADLQVGDLLSAGFKSNYRPEITMNHIYFTALVNGAGLAAELSKGNGSERVYIVEPTGNFENDPNVTDKKFPGNPTRSYRSQEPLRIVGEVTDWVRLTPEELQNWRNKLANIQGYIVN